MGHAYAQSVILETHECHKCHIVYAMPEQMVKRCRELGDTFYCPNGHGAVFTKSELTRTQEKLAEQTRIATREAERAAKAEAENKRIAKRIAAGVCPCCNRTFKALQRHMKTKHPTYLESK